MPKNHKLLFAGYSLDSETFELRKGEFRIALPLQAARLLYLLASKSPSVVSRAEVRQMLWSDDVTVDFERGINKLISQIRESLRDDSRKPIFIETMPQLGYRFLPGVALEDLKADLVQVSGPTSITAPVEPLALLTSEADTRKAKRRLAIVLTLGVIVAACVALLLTFTWGRWHPKQTPTKITIGVAPFQVDGEQARMVGDSMRLEFVDALSQLPNTSVCAVNSMNNRTLVDPDALREARQLHFDYLLLGRVYLKENQYQMILELVRGSDGTHVATLQYVGSVSQLASFRDQFQRDIFLKLDRSRRAAFDKPNSTVNSNAYYSYLQGRFFLAQRTDDDLRQALESFQASSKIDPNFAGAYAGMAGSWLLLAEHDAVPREQGYEQAEQLARKALEIEPDLADAHAVAGYTLLRHDWDFKGADRELRRAIQLDPNQAGYRIWYALLLSDQLLFKEALSEIDTAKANDPFWPPVLLTEVYIAACANQSARMKLAADELVKLMPGWWSSHRQLGYVYWDTNRPVNAIAEWRQAAIAHKDNAQVVVEDQGLEAFRTGGIVAYAKVRLAALMAAKEAKAKNLDLDISEWQVKAGQTDNAIKTLTDLVQERNADAVLLEALPEFRILHSDPRFQKLILQIGLPPIK